MIFAVLDVSLAVNLCINCSFFTFIVSIDLCIIFAIFDVEEYRDLEIKVRVTHLRIYARPVHR